MAAAIAPKLLAAGLDCYLLRLPPGMDVNAYALQAADPSQALGAIIRKAEWLGKGQAGRHVPAVEVPQPADVPAKRNRTKSKPTMSGALDDWTTGRTGRRRLGGDGR